MNCQVHLPERSISDLFHKLVEVETSRREFAVLFYVLFVVLYYLFAFFHDFFVQLLLLVTFEVFVLHMN
jgi:hypothetical protein